MKKLIVFVLLITPAFVRANGKRDTAYWNFSVTPQNLFNNCLRFDFERRLSGNDWVGFGQQFYFGTVNNNDSAFGPLSTVIRYNTPRKADELSGAGIVLEDKLFLDGLFSGYSGLYFYGGVSYSRLNISYQDNKWVPYQQNGQTYYGFSPANGNLKIDRKDFIFALGYTGLHNRVFHLDVMLGGVIQDVNTTYTGLGKGYRNYNQNVFDFQYEGAYPLLIFQFGFLF